VHILVLTSKYCFVAGGNTGVGKQTVKVRSLVRDIEQRRSSLFIIQALLNHNAKVYLAARSVTKANAAIADLKDETGKEAIFLQLDLADIIAVRKSAEEFLSCVLFSCSTVKFSLTSLSGRRVSCIFSSIMRKWLGSVRYVNTCG